MANGNEGKVGGQRRRGGSEVERRGRREKEWKRKLNRNTTGEFGN